MIRVLVNGAAGHMGGQLINLIESTEGYALAAGVDKMAAGGAVLPSLDAFSGAADVAVDFSHHTAVRELLAWAVEKKLPTVIATTGHDAAEKAAIEAASAQIPVFWAANLSMGIALMAETVTKLTAAFPEADIEIVEKHHNRKLDAPSGTALMLFDAVRAARPAARAVCGRSGMGKREKDDVGISALRMGNLPGEHEVIFTTPTQSLSIRHEAYDRALFAEGALKAAAFLCGKSAGLYDMKNLLRG